MIDEATTRDNADLIPIESIRIEDNFNIIRIFYKNFDERETAFNKLKTNDLFKDLFTDGYYSNGLTMVSGITDIKIAKILNFFAGVQDNIPDTIHPAAAIARAMVNAAQVISLKIEVPSRIGNPQQFRSEFDLAMHEMLLNNSQACKKVMKELASWVTTDYVCKLLQDGAAMINRLDKENKELKSQLAHKIDLEETVYAAERSKAATKIQSIFRGHVAKERFEKIHATILELTADKKHSLARELRLALQKQDWKAANNIIDNKDKIAADELTQFRDLKRKISTQFD